MFGGSGQTPDMELDRPALLRRVDTQSHIDYVFEVILKVFAERDKIKAPGVEAAPPRLRQFTARLREVDQ